MEGDVQRSFKESGRSSHLVKKDQTGRVDIKGSDVNGNQELVSRWRRHR
jgi:hypothetical protein